MVSTEEQLRKIRLLSDVELYDQAVKFMRGFEQQKRRTIPPTQLNGMVNITKAGSYRDVLAFVKHQQERAWPERSAFMKPFYLGLAGELRKIEQLAAKTFRSLSSEQGGKEGFQELLLLIVREFIQHLAAENGYLEGDKKRRDREERERNTTRDRRNYERTN